MRAAAQFDRPAHGVAATLTHRDHAHLIAILLAEQRAGARGDGVVDRHDPRRHRRILQNEIVGDVLDLFEFAGGDRFRMGNIEAQAVGRDQRAFLRDVIAEDLPQRLVQQMRGRVILPDRTAPPVIDFQIERGADL